MTNSNTPGGAQNATPDTVMYASRTLLAISGRCVAPRSPSGPRDATNTVTMAATNGTTIMDAPTAMPARNQRALAGVIGFAFGAGASSTARRYRHLARPPSKITAREETEPMTPLFERRGRCENDTMSDQVRIRAAETHDVEELGRMAAELVRFHHALDAHRFLLVDGVERGYARFFGSQLDEHGVVILVAEGSGQVTPTRGSNHATGTRSSTPTALSTTSM
jgi:hypothetical protein